MKKAKAILIIILIFILTYFLQINFFSWFTIRGVMPNLFIGLTLLIGLFAGKKLGGIFGLIFGILLDFLVGKSIGFSGILLAGIGLLGEYFDKNFSKDNLLTIIAMLSVTTIIYEVCMYTINTIKFGATAEIASFLIILAIETLYNALIIIILYPIIKKIGYYIEDIFKGKKILTRYF
jgi:rod shape-determining protein MreD